MNDHIKDIGSFGNQSFNSALNEQKNFNDTFEIDPRNLMIVLIFIKDAAFSVLIPYFFQSYKTSYQNFEGSFY